MARPLIDEVIDDSAPALIQQLRAAGFELEASGDRLRVRPADRVTPALRDKLSRHKPGLLAVLQPVTFITLKNGPTLPAPVIVLVCDLEARGIPLRTDATHQFIVPNDPRLTAADRLALTRWRHHVGAAIEYRAPEIS